MGNIAAFGVEQRVYRSRDYAILGGVCAGLAQRFDCDAIVVRILAVLLTFLTAGFALIAYGIMWASLPLESESASLYDVRPESAESSSFGAVNYNADDLRKTSHNIPVLARLAVAVGLMVLFLAVAMGVSPLVPGTTWWQFWPLAFLITGLCFIIIPIRTRRETFWHVVGISITTISASILPMSLGIMSWYTVNHAFVNFWFLPVAAIVLFTVAHVRESDPLLFAAAFCVVLFCLAGVTLCVVPGELETLLFYMPMGHPMNLIPLF